jgi:hypothetical protein
MSKKRRNGRLPSMVNLEQFTHLQTKPSSVLAARRNDLGSLMHVHGAMANKLRIESEAITAIMHSRENPELEVTDHAVIRWLEKVKKFDVDALRKEIADAAIEAKHSSNGQTCRAKGDAVSYVGNGVTFIVAQRNKIVTVVLDE